MKVKEIFFARCQKSTEELENESKRDLTMAF